MLPQITVLSSQTTRRFRNLAMLTEVATVPTRRPDLVEGAAAVPRADRAKSRAARRLRTRLMRQSHLSSGRAAGVAMPDAMVVHM
jgi:hypothetical protein